MYTKNKTKFENKKARAIILGINNPNLRTITTDPCLVQVLATPHQNPTAINIMAEFKSKSK